MAEIHKLSQSVINKIAAGEVIERPASVVKELMENALDAKATRIDVYADKGGDDLIRVVDNGCGIPADQLTLAVAAHATSKINDADDLFRVGTMGFRGEALASIAEISQFRIKSRTPDSVEGAQIEVTGGQVGEVIPCGCPVGTSLEVLNIFCNTPVRKKYLKSVSTEFGYVSEQFYRIAIPNPQIAFSLTHNGKQATNLPISTSLQQRIADVFGRELSENLIWVQSNVGQIKISGYVGHPSQTRSNNKAQYVFLNGRFIRDKSLQHALQEAYRGLITVGRYPIAFLFLEMPFDMVDVNVHPTKMEVRFRDSTQLYSLLLSSIRQKFLTSDMRSRVHFPSPENGANPLNPNYNQEFNNPVAADGDYSDDPDVPSPPVGGAGPVTEMKIPVVKWSEFEKFGKNGEDNQRNQPPLATYPGTGQPPQGQVQTAFMPENPDISQGIAHKDLVSQSDYLESSQFSPQNNANSQGIRQPTTENPRTPFPTSQFGRVDTAGGQNNPGSPLNTVSVDDFPGIGNKKVPDFRPFGDSGLGGGAPGTAESKVPDAPMGTPKGNQREKSTELPVKSVEEKRFLAPVIQIHNRYIVTELPEGLAIIDQHALHERILYEKIKKSVEKNEVVCQHLLVPMAVDLTPQEFAIFLERKEDLERTGLIVEPFGGQTVLINAYPAILKNQHPEELLRDVIDMLVNEVKKIERIEIFEAIYHRMACHAAIKAGMPISEDDMRSLLFDMTQCDDPHHCPHGRPSVLVYTQAELDKQFKRT